MTTIADEVRDRLERLRSRPEFPKSPVIRRFEVVEGEDSTNDPAIFVWALLDDRTPDDEQTFEKVRPIQDLVFDEVRNLADDHWPYIRFLTEEEYAETVEA